MKYVYTFHRQRAMLANVKKQVVHIVTTVLKGLSNCVLKEVLSDLSILVLWWSLELTE